MKQNQLLLSILLTCTLFSFSPLTAEAQIKENDIILSISHGAGIPTGSSLNVFAKPPLAALEGPYNLTSTNQERQMLGLMQSSQPEPEAKSNQSQIGMELGINNWFGVGFSFSRYLARVENVPLFNAMFGIMSPFMGIFSSSCFSPFNSGCINQAPGQIEYLKLLRGTVKFEPLNTLDGELYIHIPVEGNVDPYLMAVIGFGMLESNPIIKGGANLGMRYFFESGFYLGVEAFYHSFTISVSDVESGSSYSISTQNRGANFRIGFRIR